MPKLTFVLEDGQDVVVPVGERVSLGRDDGNDVVVDDQRISARHAELVRGAEGSYEVRDLDSKAGTFVNGDRVEKRKPVGNGDKIAFGPLIAVFDLEEPAPPANGTSENKKPPVREKPVARKVERPPLPKKGDKEVRKEPRPEIVPRNWKKKEAPALTVATAKIPPLPPEKKEETPAELFGRLEAGQRGSIEKLEKDKMRLQGEVDALQKALRDWQDRAAKAQDAAHGEQRKLDDARKDLAVAQAEIKSALAQEEHLQAQLREAANELSAKGARVEKLRAEEERLGHVTVSLRDAETSHAQWIEAINALSTQFDQKNSEVLRLAAAAESALRETESVSAHRDEELAHLKQLCEERESNESHLGTLRQQVAGFEARSQEVKMLVDARNDQVHAAEKRLEHLERQRGQVEAQIKQMSGVEKRLEQAREQCEEMESKSGLLNSTLASLNVEKQRAEELVEDLQAQAGRLREGLGEINRATGEAHKAQAAVEEKLHRVNADCEIHEKDLAAKREELARETVRLQEARAERADLAAQCKELADTGRKLSEAKDALAATERRLDDLKTEIHGLDARRDASKAAVGELAESEKVAAGRVEVLRGKEAALQDELKVLATAEREQRQRFEEIRHLAAEAEKEAAAQKEELARSVEVARRELADMEIKVAPLRDWKLAMDQRYARLAALPEDSAEARELWQEIESEKGNLKNVVNAAPGSTRGVSLNESVLKGIVANVEKKARVSKGVLHAPAALSEEADTPEQRANVGAAGTGAMYSGTGQEMALKARVNRLRESIQREAMRLEFLRQERAREETRTKSGPAGETMMREHDRQLESKIRREEERFATLQRKLEMGEIDEEKRRDRITDMERKLAELRSDITDAERQRNDLRHQADLVQTELKNYESALDRVKKMAE